QRRTNDKLTQVRGRCSVVFYLSTYGYAALPHLHSFPTRRSSDLLSYITIPTTYSASSLIGRQNNIHYEQSLGSVVPQSLINRVLLRTHLLCNLLGRHLR